MKVVVKKHYFLNLELLFVTNRHVSFMFNTMDLFLYADSCRLTYSYKDVVYRRGHTRLYL